jgi:protein-tyrosine phosphatase
MIRHLEFDRLHNFRDTGGYRTADGRTTAWRTLYRSDSLGKLRESADQARFAGLGVRTVIDLRYPWEADRGGRVPESDGLRYHNLSIEHRPYDQAALGNDFDPWRYLADRFWEVAHDGTAEIRQVLEAIADPGSGTTVVHCTSGKDRTGLITALVLTLVGVAEDDVVTDFARTEAASERLIADWKAAYPDRELVWAGYGRAPAEVIRFFLDDIAAAYGSLHGYAAEKLGVDEQVVKALQDKLLTG